MSDTRYSKDINDQILVDKIDEFNIPKSKIVYGDDGGYTDVTDDTPLPTSSVQVTSPWVCNVTQFGSSDVVTGTGTSGSGIPRVTVSNDSNILATQSGTWTTGRTWVAASGTDSITSFQGGTWTTGRTWTAASGTDSITAFQGGTWTTGRTWVAASGTDSITSFQGGTWTTGRTWTAASGSDSITAFQGGAWTTGRTWTAASGTDSITSFQGTSPWVNNISQFGGTNVSTGTGSSGVGIPRVTVSNDSKVIVWDGTNTSTVKASATPAATGDTSIVIAVSPNSPLPTGSNIIGAATTGIVQTTAPVVKTTGTATQNTTDEYSRQTILLPESINAEWGQMFGLSTNSAALTGTTETAFLYFKNPNASGKNAKILAFTLGPTLGNNYVTYRFYIDPTVSANGSAVTINGNRQTGQNSSIINAFTVPTVSANGTLFDTYVNSGLSGSTIYVDVNFCLWVEPNHSLLVTRQLSANATIGGVSVKWTEQ